MFDVIGTGLEESHLAELRLCAKSAERNTSMQSVEAAGYARKNCLTVPYDCVDGQRVAEIVGPALATRPEFVEVAMPFAMTTPRLVVYEAGMMYGPHFDSPSMSSAEIRSDLALSLFVTGPEEYEGGELRVALGDLSVDVRGQSGTAIVYPAGTMHEVRPVISGTRIVVIAWIQSRVPSAEKRAHLTSLVRAERMLRGEPAEREEALSSIRHVRNALERLWANHDTS